MNSLKFLEGAALYLFDKPFMALTDKEEQELELYMKYGTDGHNITIVIV
jgi:hypothetical protein